MFCIFEKIPCQFRNGTVKCRITYTRTILNIEFDHYTPRRVRSLRMVNADDIDYHLKYADRNRLQDLCSRKGDADEVLIVKNGLVTDTSYSNIICLSAAGWLTPAKPLLEGVMRRHLLETGMIEEADITPDMLRPGNGISEVILINAMLPPGSVAPIPVRQIWI